MAPVRSARRVSRILLGTVTLAAASLPVSARAQDLDLPPVATPAPAAGSAATPASAAGSIAPPAPAAPPVATPSPAAPRNVALDVVALHRDNYFLLGFAKKHQAKFQVSVKIDLWPNEGHHAFAFAYSQRSRWNVYDRSAPFAENNYSPEMFYTYWNRLPRYEPPAGCGFFRERVGAQHESNGESYPTSRGWNRIYASARYACYDDERERYVLADLRAWAPPFGTKGNPDIAKFYGYGELSLSVGSDGTRRWFDAFDLTVQARKGTRDWGTGSVQVDARWKPPLEVLRRFTPFLVAQLFHGHGETLLRYDEVVTAFRVGVGFAERSTIGR